jgi:hypothetical protein
MAQGPKWDVYFFNDKTRVYCCSTSAEWYQTLKNTRGYPAKIAWHKASTGRIVGLSATKYVNNMTRTPGCGSKDQDNQVVKSDYWEASDIKVPQQVSRTLAAIYRLPSMKSNIPLRLAQGYRDGRVEAILDTYRQQSVAIPNNFFVVPTRYTLVKNEAEVAQIREQQEATSGQLSALGATDADKTVVCSKPKLDLGDWRPGRPVSRAVLQKYHKYLGALQQYREAENRKPLPALDQVQSDE